MECRVFEVREGRRVAADDICMECRNGDPEIEGIDKTCLKTPYFHCTVSKLLKEFQMIFTFYSFFILL